MATKKKKDIELKNARKDLEQQVKPVIAVQLAGILLEVIAEYIATGKMGSPLRLILQEADTRAKAAAWRKNITKMLGEF